MKTFRRVASLFLILTAGTANAASYSYPFTIPPGVMYVTAQPVTVEAIATELTTI